MTKSDIPDLLPCPFCGGEALIHSNNIARTLWRVTCKRCDAGPSSTMGQDSACEQWSRRTASPPDLGRVGVPVDGKVEPNVRVTDAMVKAAQNAYEQDYEYAINDDDMRAAIEAALSSAPVPPSAADGKVEPVAYQQFKDGKWVECSYFVAFGWGTEIDKECRALYASPPARHSDEEAEPQADIIPGLDLLSDEEKQSLLTKAEDLWQRLDGNELGGFSGQNRPFCILNAFKEVIEGFGKRNIGWRHSKNEIDAHRAALSRTDGKEGRDG